ncbi:MAG: HYR domain-containing protein [Chloroflexi bacterium]|nr:HYR domain-containing protein [Chloroflexota bacterium]
MASKLGTGGDSSLGGRHKGDIGAILAIVRRAALAAIVVLLLLSAGLSSTVPVAYGHGTVDQSFFTNPVSYAQICSGVGGWNGQTFTPSRDNIVGFDVYFLTFGGATALGKIFSITDFPNTGNVLATAPPSTAPNGLVHFDLPAPLSLNPGQKYAIMLTGGGNTCFRASYHDPNYRYTGGGAVRWYGPEDGNVDISFRTYFMEVGDTTPPAITVPGPITAEATGPAGASVTFSVSAVDLVDGNRPVTCSPASGSTFPLGTTTVSCSASDLAGNTSSSSFTVTVQDTAPPVISGIPANITVEATGASGAIANWPAPTASDVVDGNRTVTCSPASGSTFALGTTTVNCSASDTRGNTSSASFSVTVVDTTPPALTLPSNITAEATGPSGAAVSFTVSATDLVDGVRPVTCTPASGSSFAIGTTTVNCSASDTRGNVSSGSFSVTVADTTAPSLAVASVTAPADGYYPTQTFNAFPATVGSQPVTLNGTATDVVGMASVKVNGLPATYMPSAWSIANVSLLPGANTLNVAATDLAGNVSSASVSTTFNSDLDGDGIANNVDGDCLGAPAYANASNNTFSDKLLGGMTCGTIISRSGYAVAITDAPNPDGVQVVVSGSGTGKVRIQLDSKASVVKLGRGTYILTDPDQIITVEVIAGEPAEVDLTLNGQPVVIVIGVGGKATITEITDSNGNLVGVQVTPTGNVTLNGRPLTTGQTLTLGGLVATLELNGNRFNLQATFTPGSGSNGLSPASEALALNVGTFAATIPAGSFRAVGNGHFNFQGTINGARVVGQIKALSGGRYSIHVEAQSANLAGTANPVTVNVIIGDDGGTATVSAKPK